MRLHRVGRGLLSAAPVSLPLTFAVAACIGGLELGTEEQPTTIPLQDFDFGEVQVHTTSAKQTFTIRPASGVQSDRVDSIAESCPDFEVTATGLPADVTNVCVGGSGCPTYQATTYAFTATFTPAVTGATSCAVKVVINGTPTTFTLTGKGKEPAVRAAISPTSALDLGEVRIGDTSSAASVQIRNYGSGPAPLTVTSVALDAGGLAAGLAIASGTTTTHVLAPGGGREQFDVTCAPTAPGPVSGTLTITTDDPAAPTSTIAVTCAGVSSSLAFGPSSPALLAGTQAQGATRVGEPVDLPVTLRNAGTASMTVHQLAVAGAGLSLKSGPAAEQVLAPGASAQAVLSYAPTQPAAQGTIGTLSVSYDNGQVRTLNVLGAALPTSMAINPDGEVDLGPVCVTSSASRDFFILKNNPGTFKITSVEQPQAPFQLTGDLPTSGPLAIDDNAIHLTATVTPTAPMPLSSSFAIATDIPGAAPHVVTLNALGLAAGISATPMAMDLGTISVGATSIGQTLTVTNCDAAPLTLLETQVTGPNKDDFAVATAPTTATIAPGASATYVIVTRPNNPGDLAATLQVRHDRGMIEIPLTGAGTGMVVDDRVPEASSYYSCAAGGAGGAGGAGVPLAAALAAIARRRRRAAR